MAAKKRNLKKGLTLIELMVVVLIVAILAAIAIPIYRSRIDAAKWSEGRSMVGSIATAIRAYHAEKGPNGDAPTAIFGAGDKQLGFATGDLDGTYFADGDFSMNVSGMDPLAFTVTCTAGGGSDAPTTPASYQLDEDGVWTVP